MASRSLVIGRYGSFIGIDWEDEFIRRRLKATGHPDPHELGNIKRWQELSQQAYLLIRENNQMRGIAPPPIDESSDADIIGLINSLQEVKDSLPGLKSQITGLKVEAETLFKQLGLENQADEACLSRLKDCIGVYPGEHPKATETIRPAVAYNCLDCANLVWWRPDEPLLLRCWKCGCKEVKKITSKE